MSDGRTKEEMADRPVICGSCVTQRRCRERGRTGAVACSMYYRRPENLREWLRYWWFKVSNRLGAWAFYRNENRAWRRYCRSVGSIPSTLKAGDVIQFTYPDEIERECGGKPGMVHSRKILRIWAELGPTENGWGMRVRSIMSDNVHHGPCYGTGDVIENDLPKNIISINGKTTFPRWGYKPEGSCK